MPTNRRIFCAQAATLLLSRGMPALQISHASTSRPDVAAIDHDRIVEAGEKYLKEAPVSLVAMPCKRSPGGLHDFYSEADGSDAFTAHRDALLGFSIQASTLASAYVLTKQESYAEQALRHLRTWFVDSATRMTPSLVYAQTVPPAKEGRPEGIVETVHLAEVAQSIPFLASSDVMTGADREGLQSWFASYLEWLTNSRLAGLARDQKNHHGSSWLLQTVAFNRLILSLNPNANDAGLNELRQRYKRVTIRAQIVADGTFPHELSTVNPYRLSLFNLDMLAAICLLLSTRFESVWDYDLQDGPGMRAAMARYFPYIRNRGTWPYVADAKYFDSLPLRQPSLLFAAKAYTRPEYADLWRTLPADTDVPELQRTFPIRQPLLWVTTPKL